EIVEVGLDLRPGLEGVPHLEEDLLDEGAYLGDRVRGPGLLRPPGQGQVDRLPLPSARRDPAAGRLERGLDVRLEVVDRLARCGAFGGVRVTQFAERE